MSNIPATLTEKNLEGAFAGESMAFIKLAVKPRAFRPRI